MPKADSFVQKLQRAIAERQIAPNSDPSSLPSLARFGKGSTGSKGTDTHEHTSSSKSEERMSTNRPKRRYKRHPKVGVCICYMNDPRGKQRSCQDSASRRSADPFPFNRRARTELLCVCMNDQGTSCELKLTLGHRPTDTLRVVRCQLMCSSPIVSRYSADA